MKVNATKNNLISIQKMLKSIAHLPEQITKENIKLQNKLLKINIQTKLNSSQIDTYA